MPSELGGGADLISLRAARLRGVNLGSGAWRRRGWQTVDYYAGAEVVDHVIDFRLPHRLPYADSVVPVIFCSHLLEHLEDDSARALIGECHRVIRPGGVLRLSVPDGELALDAYRRQDRSFFEQGGVWCVGSTMEQLLANFFASFRDSAGDHGPDIDGDVVRRLADRDLEELVGYCVSTIPSDAAYIAHVNGFDFTRLQQMLIEAGFSDVRRSRYRQSARRELRRRAFDNRPRVSLFVEADK